MDGPKWRTGGPTERTIQLPTGQCFAQDYVYYYLYRKQLNMFFPLNSTTLLFALHDTHFIVRFVHLVFFVRNLVFESSFDLLLSKFLNRIL